MTEDVPPEASGRRSSAAAPAAGATEQGPGVAGGSAGKPAGKPARGTVAFLRDILVIFLIAILVSFLIKTFLVRSFYIPSGSMMDTLQVDDRIIVNQLTPDLGPLSRGDVVVFQDPGGWLDPSPHVDQAPAAVAIEWLLSVVGLAAPDSNDHLIKRVIGLPGDEVACCNALGQMMVNGIPLDEPYVKLPSGVSKVSEIDFSVTVPDDSLWVMGDNRYNSRDSRFNMDEPSKGFVPMGNVVGRALLVSWPITHWAWLGDYPDTFRDVGRPEDE